jgi:sarcosine oxidase, subunit beta
MTPAIGIIGGGAIGLTAAVHLARRGASNVTVLEKSHIAAGSSGLSVGIIETQYVDPLDIELRVRSMAFFRELERAHGLHVVHNGYLRLAHSDDDLRHFANSVEIQRCAGVADARVLEPAEIERIIPDLSLHGVVGGLFGPSDGFIDGHLYCGLLTELATSSRVRILTRQFVREAAVDEQGRHVVVAGAEQFVFDYVIVAAGAWGEHVAGLFNAEMPLLPQRHQAVVVHLPRKLEYVMPSVMDYTPRTGDLGLYFRHERPGQLIAGVHTEEPLADLADPDHYRHSADPEFLETVAELLSARLPSLADASLDDGWAGIYPISADGRAQVGPAPHNPTIILAGAAGGSGIQLSPALGELAAEWVLDGEPRSITRATLLAPGRESLSPLRPTL